MYQIVHRFAKMLNGKIASGWLILLIDVVIIWLSFLFAQVIRFNFEISNIVWSSVLLNSLVVLFINFFFFIVFRSYATIIRHTSLHDILRVFRAMTSALVLLFVISILNKHFQFNKNFVLSISVLVIFYFNSVFALVFVRILIKLIYHNTFHPNSKPFTNVIIYGAGEQGVITKNTLTSNGATRYKIIGFVDDNPRKIGKSIDGIRIFKPEIVNEEFIEKKNIDELIFSIQNINSQKKQRIIDDLIKFDIVIKIVPTIERWINGELDINQIAKLKIEDLLQRDPIKIDNPKISEAINGKVVLVTGGAGSIGSEIVRQSLNYSPALIVIVDNAESPIFDLKQELVVNGDAKNKEILKFIIADITDQRRTSVIFSECKPSFVYHAAAYKHVPLMEDNPEEALRVNVFGTKNIADLSVANNVERFVMISTDKAVRPTNVMGASKRLAEMYCQSLSQTDNINTRFITTRFGNVLGSNGSVVKIFRKQINSGGPVTVTHPEITRFFMTIPEACQLVLEASIMGSGSDIFVFDMGEAVKVDNLARKMIKLAGFQPDKDIKIVYSGLRSGEKLYEELLNNSENTIDTYHPKIMIANIDHILNGSVLHTINEIKEVLKENDQFKLVGILKKAIPEYISNNSVFQRLDA